MCLFVVPLKGFYVLSYSWLQGKQFTGFAGFCNGFRRVLRWIFDAHSSMWFCRKIPIGRISLEIAMCIPVFSVADA